MKRYIILTLIIFSVGVSAVLGQSSLFKKGNELYGKGNYKAAADTYEKILKEEGIAPEIYYNLGNAYYKLNETGLSILNYERALRLSPNYENARVNLELAQLRVIDNVHQISSFFVLRWFESAINLFTTNQWLYISVILFVLTITFILTFIYSYSAAFRRGSFYIALILFIFSMTSVTFSYVKKNVIDERKEAILMTGSVTVKSSPDKSGTNLFQIHEGIKVRIQSSLGDWTEIKLGNGNVGWIENKNIEII
jgi:tetratricopeptide (TPR) repeat protein